VSVRLKKYRKSFPHSYAFGVYPTLELLSTRPECVQQVLLHAPEKGGRGIRKVRHACRARSIPTLVCPRVIRRLSGRDFPAVAVFRKYRRPVGPQANHVVLHRPQYEGNVGTIIRTMVGFGLGHLVIVGAAPDVMSPSVIRGSMGAVFRLHWSRFDSLKAYQRTFSERCLYYFTTDGRLSVEQLVPEGKFSFVFGSEGAGLPAAATELGTTVRIRHSGSIDSLNLAVAVGIALHEAAHMF